MSKQSDIIYQLRQGDNQKAIAQLYESFPMIRKFIFNHGGNAADAQDVFQEALLIFYRNAQKPDFQLTCAASTYLYSVVRFLWKDTLKKKNKEVLVEDDIREVSVAFDDQIERVEIQQEKTMTLAKVFEQLGKKCQQILQAYYYQKMSMKDIAQQFGYGSVNSAKTQKYKCIERAKKNANSI
jgi:RNA polymerase sigma factor (sigma-70 family)